MSFAIALDQVTRKSWRSGGEEITHWRPESPEITKRRENVLAYVKAAGKKVTTDDIMAELGVTRQQVRYAMEKLVDDGKIIQHRPRHDFSLWSASPTNTATKEAS